MKTGTELPRAHRNRLLFSNHFLERRLRREPVWTEVAEEAERVRTELRELLQRQRPALEGSSEAQTEERWIRPVLRALGWGFEVQPRSRRLGSVRFPDYALFPTAEEAARAAALREHRRVLREAVGVMEAKRWGRDLDAPGGAGEDARVPSAQIVNYLIRADQPWGVLTNGREWRLYYRDADFADTAYFAVDLPTLLGDGPLASEERGETISGAEAFRYFFLFFRPEAFTPDPHGKRWLGLVRESSARYAREVEEALKPRAYRAVTALCRGFVAAEAGDPAALASDPERSRQVLDNALTLLFRLLFVLYAESRDLLPVRTNPAYRRKSLLQLRERAAAVRDRGEELFPRGRDFWNDLRDLFAIVDGDPQWRAVGIPVYDGGLFDPAKHPWLERHHVADPRMAEALDLLSRVEDPEAGGLHFVDYSPLDVRHLGSIYEGLLEHVLRVADEELPAIREDGEVVRDPVARGELYLATDKGERKTTGSYYTPDYVVQYIVRRTLEPLVEGKPPSEILRLRVLDPAMGSGHFLVAATSFLARMVVGAAEAGPQHGLGELAELDPEHLRRLVVERCIFGVDVNPRAVELAKLSLWLATVQRDKPLNFLDHHLKCGDSLLGARIGRLGGVPGRRGRAARLEEGGQFNAFDAAFRSRLVRTLGFIHRIEELRSDTLEDVELKEELYREADATLDRFRQVADVWCSVLFGNELSGDDYARLLEALPASEERWTEIAEEGGWFRRAGEIASARRFFHWEVEFGEVFYDEEGREREAPGFDAVVGNPPYVRMEEFKDIKDFLRHEYETHATRSDLYVYFVERSLDLLREGGEYGEYGAIVSNKFLRANYGKALRAYISRVGSVREIVDFGGLPVFPEATVRAAILLMGRRRIRAAPCLFAEISRLDFVSLEDEVMGRAVPVDPAELRGENWLLVPMEVGTLLGRLREACISLEEYLEVPIAYGIKTGLNEAFFISDETRQLLVSEDLNSQDLIRPLVVGTDIRRYHVNREDKWLIYVPHGTRIDGYPAVKRHLEQFRTRLARRATNQEWFELQQPQPGYVDFYGSTKILYPVISRDARFALDNGGLFPNDKCYLIPVEDMLLLGILNSTTVFFYLTHVVARLEGRSAADSYLELRTQYMAKLPIPRTRLGQTGGDGRSDVLDWFRSLYHRGLRLAGLEPEIPEDIWELGRRIGELDGVERVLLLGSWARGEAREDSDVDLLVVRSGDGARAERRLTVYRHIDGHTRRPTDVLVYSPKELERERRAAGSFLSHVLPEGVVLYDSG